MINYDYEEVTEGEDWEELNYKTSGGEDSFFFKASAFEEWASYFSFYYNKDTKELVVLEGDETDFEYVNPNAEEFELEENIKKFIVERVRTLFGDDITVEIERGDNSE